MKYLIQILSLVILFTSCTKDDIESDRLFFDEVQVTNTIIEIDVIPTEGIQIDFQEMVDEVNVDYFNRYNMNIEFTLRENQNLPDYMKNGSNEMFIPGPSEKYKMTLYIVPDQYLRFGDRTANGYAIQGNDVMVVRESSYKNSTVAHEIGHLFGLGHHGEWNDNIMGEFSTKKQYDIPSEFVQEQLDSIQINLDMRKKYKDLTSKSFKTQSVIID